MEDQVRSRLNELLSEIEDYQVVFKDNIQARMLLNSLELKISEVVGLMETPVLESNLTNRELECLGYLAQGYTNKEIATAMSISQKTIEYHLSSIFKKTESTTRTEAVSNAIKLKIIKP